MTIDVTQTIKNYAGENVDYQGKPLTLRDAFTGAINNTLPNEVLTAEQKAKIYALSIKIYSANEINLTVDDMAFIKERCAIIWNPLIYGRVCELFDNPSTN